MERGNLYEWNLCSVIQIAGKGNNNEKVPLERLLKTINELKS